MKTKNIIISFACVLLTLFLCINKVLSYGNKNIQSFNNQAVIESSSAKRNVIRMGVKLPSELFGKIRYRSPEQTKLEGYCINLGERLADKFKKEVTYTAIANDNAGDRFRRYQGVRSGLIDLECGPNTIFEPLKLSPIDEDNKWKEDIVFSDSFYATDIKLLLKRSIADELESALRKSDKDFYEKMKESQLKIEVVKDTTTQLAFQAHNNSTDMNKYIINTHRYKIADNDSNSEQLSPPKTRYEALFNLDTKQDTAFASDLPILQTILEKGFIDKEYVIFPQEKDKYLPGFADPKYKQRYGVAFYSKANLDELGMNLDVLKAGVNRIIEQEDLQQALQTRNNKIEGKIGVLQSYFLNPTNSTKKDDFENISEKNKKSIWLTILTFICAAFMALIFIYAIYVVFKDPSLRTQFLTQYLIHSLILLLGYFATFASLLLNL